MGMWKQQNTRRIELLRRRLNKIPLSAAETIELQTLQALALDRVERKGTLSAADIKALREKMLGEGS